METNPEEKINQERWYVLREIREKFLRTKKGSPIHYTIHHNFVGGDGPTSENEAHTLGKLEELGVIKISERKMDLEDRELFELEVIEPNFGDLYSKYEKIFSAILKPVPERVGIKNLTNSDSGKPKASKYFKHPVLVAVVTGIFVVIAAFIQTPQWFNFRKKGEGSESLTTESRTNNTPADSLRGLEALETGKKISDLPNSVYFYATAQDIVFEVQDPARDWIDVRNNKFDDNFEVQKVNGRYYFIGYISDDVYSELGSLGKKNLYGIVFPYSWGGARKIIGVPFDAIYTISWRRINIDERKTMGILEVGFREVTTEVRFH